MEQKTKQLAFNYDETGDTSFSRGKGTSAVTAQLKETLVVPSLIEAVVERENMLKALKRVKENKGAPGIDGITTDDMDKYLKNHWQEIKVTLLNGTYSPKPVRRVEIPKPDGGVRLLGIPTVVDRLIQQVLLQILTKIYNPTFSSSSYGFRPGKSAHQALKQAKEYVESGNAWVVDLDLEKFFDRVNHDILMNRISRRITDKRVLKLIRAYLNAGVMINGVVMEAEEGTPQGGPLSPLLANILLDEFDKELEKRNHQFCRYADDCNIYVASKRSGERVMQSLTNFLEKKLKLQVNQKKSAVAKTRERKFLGLRIVKGKETYISISPKSTKRFKKKVRKITKRNRGIRVDKMLEDLNRYTTGWLNYFGIAKVKNLMRDLDGWIRRRIRCYVWKQWKNWRTRARNMVNAGVGRYLAYGTAIGNYGYWKVAGSPAMTKAMPNEYIKQLGYKSLLDHYMSLTSY